MLNKVIKKITDDNHGTILLMTFLILTSILTVTMGAASVMLAGIKMGGTQARSTKAYFAAEAGAERILWEVRKYGFNIGSACNDGDCVVFGSPNTCDNDCTNPNKIQTLANGSEYIIKYEYIESPPFATTTISSFGSFNKTRRVVELAY